MSKGRRQAYCSGGCDSASNIDPSPNRGKSLIPFIEMPLVGGHDRRRLKPRPRSNKGWGIKMLTYIRRGSKLGADTQLALVGIAPRHAIEPHRHGSSDRRVSRPQRPGRLFSHHRRRFRRGRGDADQLRVASSTPTCCSTGPDGWGKPHRQAARPNQHAIGDQSSGSSTFL